jgi:hypothetical protein
MPRFIVAAFMLGLLFVWDRLPAAGPEPDYPRSERLGINHISGVEEVTAPERYQKALALGAGWNRWPLYWDRVETEPGVFNWSDYDRLVQADLDQGLRINAVLLGQPGFYRDGARPTGLHQPIFEDGTDTPRPDKALNPKNPWVNFVDQAVRRYRPGGDLAAEKGWAEGEGIRIWEIWNEPDHEPFWEGSIGDYARLLKSAYIVIKQVDPEAQVMFGGLLFGTPNNWLARVLAIFEDDPLRETFNWYMDIVAVHNYSYPWRSGWLTRYVKQTLIAYDLERPIWLNESGTPVWDDYPGPVWSAKPLDKQLRSTQIQQAEFFIQSAAYAWAEGAEVVFYHQLYDDCGNQPGGTDFPFHFGALCGGNGLCFGDAFGLYRNERGAVCFSQHPLPGTPRQAARAYRLVADWFGAGTLANPQIETLENRAVVIRFDRPETDERLSVVWNQSLDPVRLRLPVGTDTVTLVTLTGQTSREPDTDGILELDLSPAACDYFPFLNDTDVTGVGGTTTVIVGPLADLEAEAELVQPLVTPRTRCPKR